jgi:AmiR/NasT family two-component response regulator
MITPLDQTAERMAEIIDIRMALRQAMLHLIARERFSSQEALDWIQQEARAKRSKLHEVAQAVLQNQPVQYQYDVPI